MWPRMIQWFKPLLDSGLLNHWIDSGLLNHWIDSGQLNHWIDSGLLNHWIDSGQLNHWIDSGPPNHWIDSGLLNHWIDSATRCASGWKFYNGSCYHFSEDKLTWEQSQYACIREGGHLVIIESQQEQDFIRMKVGNTEVKNSYWIGMTDIKEEGVWVWMDNTTLSNNTKYWDLNNGTDVSAFPEPNNWPPGEDCAQMGWRCSVQISCWFDLGCDIPSKRICESRAANY
ncbi:CD209 antigen-like protein E isoform X3 [Esox lucius]|uniref:C-type lectin domain-containing protein n=1 Tax=Esox lucius TaxID=8010 RepID=A0AAY5L1V7_ESOLU|nr:CD209 antigen-like protein E isoform X3 [Esox lucius]